MWTPVLDETITSLVRKNPQSDTAPEGHIENRHLLHVAFGRLKLAEWEQNHLHGCKVCQGLLYVFIHQPVTGVPDNLEKPGDAA